MDNNYELNGQQEEFAGREDEGDTFTPLPEGKWLFLVMLIFFLIISIYKFLITR